MAKSFADLRKNRKARAEKLQRKVEQDTSGGGGDDRFWKLTVDGEGNGYAVIRFLPEPKDEEAPYVSVYSHYFKGPGGYYSEKSRTTLGKGTDDPVAEYNRKIWDENPDYVRKHTKRQLSYYSNIYVVNDPSNPENNGKVFLFRYGPKIFDFIKNAIDPKFEDEDAFDPFDFEDGANFKLKAIQDGDYRSYDKSVFMTPSPIADKDGDELDFDQMKEIWDSEASLFEFIDPTTFKTYDELKERLNKVLELDGNSSRGGHDHEDEQMEEKPKKSRTARFQEEMDTDEDDGYDFDSDSNEDDDETEDFFANLN